MIDSNLMNLSLPLLLLVMGRFLKPAVVAFFLPSIFAATTQQSRISYCKHASKLTIIAIITIITPVIV